MFGIGGWKQVGATFDMKRQAGDPGAAGTGGN